MRADDQRALGKDNPKQYHHPGGWPPGGTIAGYLGFSGS